MHYSPGTIMISSTEILSRRQFVSIAQKAPYWAMINFSSFILCIFEFKCSFFPSLSSMVIIKHTISFFEIILMFLFLVNFLYNSYIFIWFKKFLQPLELTIEEFRLFGINEKEIGFKLKVNNVSSNNINLNNNNNKNKNIFSITPKFDISSKSILGQHSSLDSTALSTRFFNDNGSQLDIKSTSWAFIAVPNEDFSFSKRSDTSLNRSFDNFGKNYDGLRFRKAKSFLLHNDSGASGSGSGLPPAPSSAVIASKNALEHYLQEQEERQEELKELIQAEKRYGASTLSSSMNEFNSQHPYFSFNGSSQTPITSSSKINDLAFHNSMTPTKHVSFNSNVFSNNDSSFKMLLHTPTNTPPLQSSPLLLSTSYKPALKICSPPSMSNPEKSESLNSSTRAVEKILARLDVDDARLNQMVENIRKWISQTILVRLVREIDSINKIIVEKGYIDSMIGKTSIKQLKYLAENKRAEFPTLEQVCPFLDVVNIRNIENNVPFQQYLVRRLKDLAKGGCMIEFLWDHGGSYNYKPWKEDSMLTDAELILHVFCVYMDSRLLFNPAIPEGKPFSSQYLLYHSNNGSSSMTIKSYKSDTYIQQDKAYPPNYSLKLKGEQFDIPPGRNNLFYTLLIFIHHIKVKNFGLLGRINLGPSGLNIAWVIEKN